ncbi:MAG: PfkB family carbohydrate kinase [Zestosphaera sp.]
MKAVLVGSATVDVLGEGVRVGGSVYYGGLALAKHLGVETHAVTLIDKRNTDLILGSFLGSGVVLHPVECSRVPHFVIREGKAVNVVADECRIPADMVEKVLEDVRPDILMLAPVFQEVEVSEYVELLSALDQVKIKSLDIQGFVRSAAGDEIKCVWSDELFELMGLVDLTHGNLKEFCFSSSGDTVVRRLLENEVLKSSAVAATMDSRGLYLIAKGDSFKLSSLKVVSVDEVGAGDVFTAVTSHYMAAGNELPEAVMKGVVAASLKVSRSSRNWFTAEELEERLPEVEVHQHMP